MATKRMCALSTVDNPFDPFDQFDKWYMYDMVDGQNCCALLDRIAKTSDSFTDEENRIEIERAIDELIRLDFTNTFKKIVKEVEDKD